MAHFDTKEGRMYVHSRDSIYMEQRFWKAEVRGRTVITTMDGHFSEASTTKKSYASEAAADHAARGDYGKKLRVGFLPIPEAELIPLMQLVFRIGIRGEGDNRSPKKLGKPSRNVVYACRVQRYWRAEHQHDKARFVTSRGDIGGAIVTTTYPETFKGQDGVLADEKKYVGVGRGWYQSSRKELLPIERHIKAMNERLARQPAAAPVDLPAPERPLPTIVPRKLAR